MPPAASPAARTASTPTADWLRGRLITIDDPLPTRDELQEHPDAKKELLALASNIEERGQVRDNALRLLGEFDGTAPFLMQAAQDQAGGPVRQSAALDGLSRQPLDVRVKYRDVLLELAKHENMAVGYGAVRACRGMPGAREQLMQQIDSLHPVVQAKLRENEALP